MLFSSGIAVWDVCKSCVREGSLDSAIMHEIPNDLMALLERYKGIKTIAFNSRKAEELFDKYFERSETYVYLSLPSSSPANAGIRWEIKAECWKKLSAEEKAGTPSGRVTIPGKKKTPLKRSSEK